MAAHNDMSDAGDQAHSGSRTQVTITTRQVKSALTKQAGGFLNTFTHSLQPYAGCSFGQRVGDGQGCPFCYVRQLPVAKFAAEEWGSWVAPKTNIAQVLQAELARYEKRGTLDQLRIFMSSATDPYQGAEASLHLTRGCLEAFVERVPGLLVVQTRSPLVTRDIDLLQQLVPHVWVSLTLETNDDTVRRQITPTSPTVASRLKAMKTLRDAGIPVQAAISPMLPNHPIEFAAMLEPVCDRALVDTLLVGDGANGRRSEALGMRSLFERYGYADWYRPTAHEPLMSALREVFGEERVAFSQEGFNTVGT